MLRPGVQPRATVVVAEIPARAWLNPLTTANASSKSGGDERGQHLSLHPVRHSIALRIPQSLSRTTDQHSSGDIALNHDASLQT
jgi:hypothetical protein